MATKRKRLHTNTSNPTKTTRKKKVQNWPAFEDDTSILPRDILYSVLIRLPGQSLLRFRCVSKSWNAIILSDKEFKKDQRDQSRILGRENMLLQSESTGFFEFIDVESSQVKQRIPVSKCLLGAKVSCSCDGLVLLKKHNAYKHFVLWNPSTGEHQILKCPYTNQKTIVLTAFGLCYDSRVGDYKVIIITSESSGWCYAIYSLINHTWTEKIRFPFQLEDQEFYLLHPVGISTEGCVFWSLNNLRGEYLKRRNCTVIYFQVKSNEWKIFPIPHFVGENGLFRLSSWKSCLILYGGELTGRELSIWIMEQDVWRLLMKTCELPHIIFDYLKEKKLLCCNRNGEILFQRRSNNDTSLYNPERQEFVRVPYISVKASIVLDSLYFPKAIAKRKQRPPPTT